MTVNHEVPFVANTEDDQHCYSASLTMILAHFISGLPTNIDIGTRISAKPTDKAVWPLVGPLWMARHGFDVTVVFDFDYPAVAERGLDYVRERYGDEVAEYQDEYSVVPDSETVTAFLDEVDFQQRVPEVEEIKSALSGGGLAAVTVNSSLLKGEEGYMNHSVVVKGFDANGLLLNNPGLPPIPDQRVAIDDFVTAWSYPTPEARYLMTVRPSSNRKIDVDAVMRVAEEVS